MPWITAKYKGECFTCGEHLPAGSIIGYVAGKAFCAECGFEHISMPHPQASRVWCVFIADVTDWLIADGIAAEELIEKPHKSLLIVPLDCSVTHISNEHMPASLRRCRWVLDYCKNQFILSIWRYKEHIGEEM